MSNCNITCKYQTRVEVSCDVPKGENYSEQKYYYTIPQTIKHWSLCSSLLCNLLFKPNYAVQFLFSTTSLLRSASHNFQVIKSIIILSVRSFHQPIILSIFDSRHLHFYSQWSIRVDEVTQHQFLFSRLNDLNVAICLSQNNYNAILVNHRQSP